MDKYILGHNTAAVKYIYLYSLFCPRGMQTFALECVVKYFWEWYKQWCLLYLITSIARWANYTPTLGVEVQDIVSGKYGSSTTPKHSNHRM